MNSEYYCGLPQNQWDILAEQAEEILRDQEYGQHILGLYPAGPRIYGLESSSPSLLCLYVDAVDSLIDPSRHQISEHRPKIEAVGNSDSKIYFTELFSWSKWLFDVLNTCDKDFITPILPAVQDVFYEDESISTIISIARDMIRSKIRICTTGSFGTSLQARAQVIWALRGTFNPCVNPDLGVVIGLDELGVEVPDYILEHDIKIINLHLDQDLWSKTHPYALLDEHLMYVKYLDSICSCKQNLTEYLKQWKLLGKEIANLYRYQL